MVVDRGVYTNDGTVGDETCRRGDIRPRGPTRRSFLPSSRDTIDTGRGKVGVEWRDPEHKEAEREHQYRVSTKQGK